MTGWVSGSRLATITKPISGRNSGTRDEPLTVLFDGWSLVRSPGSPPALHLAELLTLLPPGIQPLVALPAPLDGPAPAPLTVLPTADTGSARLTWEQIMLPRLARRCRASALHLTSASAPLFSTVPVILSPAEPFSKGFIVKTGRGGDRLRAAFGRGGFSAARTLLWPADLPAPNLNGPAVRRLPPVAYPDVYLEPAPPHGEDSGYVAAFGSMDDEDAFAALIEAWRWAAPAMGEGWALRVVCPSSDPGAFSAQLESLREAARLPGPLLSVPQAGPRALADLLAGAGAIIHTGPLRPWGDPLLYALAAGRPLAAEETWGVDGRVGPAAYLASPGDARTLGAAILTLLVEENVAEQLSQAARERAAGWNRHDFAQQLGEIYRHF